MKVIRLIILFVLCSVLSNAQQEFNLQQCIEAALKNNIRLKQSKLSLASTGLDVKTSKAALLPNLNGSFNETFNYGRNIDPISNTYITSQTQSTNMGLNTSITVFNGFQLMNNLKLSQLNYAAVASDVLALENDLALQVAAAYLQLMYAEDNLVNAKGQLSLTISQRSRTDILIKAGKLAESAILELDAQQSNDEYNVQMAENGIVSAKLTLLQLMEMPATTSFTIQRPMIALPVAESFDVNMIFDQAVNNRPEVKSAQIRKEGALYNEKIAKGGFSPRVTFSAGINTLYSNKYRDPNPTFTIAGERLIGYTKKTFDSVMTTSYTASYKSVGFGKQLDNNFGKYMQLGVTVPLFNNFRVYSNVQKSHINIQNQELNLSQVKNTLLKSIQQAVTDVEAAKAKYAAASKSFAAQSASFNNIEIRYNQGLSSYLDYITSKNNKARAEVNMQQAKYDLILKSKIIDFYKGVNITL